MVCGLLAVTYTQATLVYSAKTAGDQYIDLTRGLALMNGKNCSQFNSKDKPLLVHGTIRIGKSDGEAATAESVYAAKNTWIVRNACVKAAAAWRRTLRSAGIRRKKQLNTYARNMRVALDARHSAVWSALGTGGNIDADIIPDDVDNSYASGQYNSDGDQIHVIAYNTDTTVTPWGAIYKQAFTQTTFAVPQSGATDVKDKPANLLGALNDDDSNIVSEYIDSRINDADIEDTDLDQSPSNDNDFVMMLAPGEEVADDVLDNVDDEGKWRPYALATSTSDTQIIAPGCHVSGQDTSFEAPLGLLKWVPEDTTSRLFIDIIAFSEM